MRTFYFLIVTQFIYGFNAQAEMTGLDIKGFYKHQTRGYDSASPFRFDAPSSGVLTDQIKFKKTLISEELDGDQNSSGSMYVVSVAKEKWDLEIAGKHLIPLGHLNLINRAWKGSTTVTSQEYSFEDLECRQFVYDKAVLTVICGRDGVGDYPFNLEIYRFDSLTQKLARHDIQNADWPAVDHTNAFKLEDGSVSFFFPYFLGDYSFLGNQKRSYTQIGHVLIDESNQLKLKTFGAGLRTHMTNERIDFSLQKIEFTASRLDGNSQLPPHPSEEDFLKGFQIYRYDLSSQTLMPQSGVFDHEIIDYQEVGGDLLVTQRENGMKGFVTLSRVSKLTGETIFDYQVPAHLYAYYLDIDFSVDDPVLFIVNEDSNFIFDRFLRLNCVSWKNGKELFKIEQQLECFSYGVSGLSEDNNSKRVLVEQTSPKGFGVTGTCPDIVFSIDKKTGEISR